MFFFSYLLCCPRSISSYYILQLHSSRPLPFLRCILLSTTSSSSCLSLLHSTTTFSSTSSRHLQPLRPLSWYYTLQPSTFSLHSVLEVKCVALSVNCSTVTRLLLTSMFSALMWSRVSKQLPCFALLVPKMPYLFSLHCSPRQRLTRHIRSNSRLKVHESTYTCQGWRIFYNLSAQWIVLSDAVWMAVQ